MAETNISTAITDAVFNLYNKSGTPIRKKHTLELTMEYDKKKNDIKISGVHRYRLHNNSLDGTPKPLEIYTDLGRQGDPKSGGFNKAIIDGRTIEDDELEGLQTHVRELDKVKACFCCDLEEQPCGYNTVEFHTYGYYRLKDRLIWTVQDFSENFTITVNNSTGFPSHIWFKINHINEDKIHRSIKYPKEKPIRIIDFKSVVLPYQGFEMTWDFTSYVKANDKEKLRAVFPDCFICGKLDVNKLLLKISINPDFEDNCG